jgi:CheY-like chemotaxis protein
VLTVLVCDEEFAVLEILAMGLEGAGHHVLRASHGQEALRMLAATACDVVVCDDTMPGMTGRELVRAIRADAALCLIPIIVMSEWPTADLAATLLPKPIRLRELLERVAEAGSSRRSA